LFELLEAVMGKSDGSQPPTRMTRKNIAEAARQLTEIVLAGLTGRLNFRFK
jgi:hypothetical protein